MELTWKRKVRTGCMRKQLELECDWENEQTGLPIGCRVRTEIRRQGDAWIFVLSS